MESRKITVVATKSQKKSVIMSAATTLAELKSDLRENGIDYTGMTFYEGTSRVELKDDASVLPHDVPYKGTTTNELVFMLTNTDKKIRSGAEMSRTEAYAKIKELGLQKACLDKYGKNFTMCKTADLINLIGDNPTKSSKKEEVKTETKEAPKTKKEPTVEAVKEETKEIIAPTIFVDVQARKAILHLVSILEGDGTIEEYEADEIKDILECEGLEDSPCEESKSSNDSSYSDEEINEMFGFVRN